MREEKSFCYSC
uniref:Uncharacterized protein n=1 Tax=Lepeophtheirus salmonis TaxID=72036 RepID=A0A0K2U3T4_LEPSM